MKTSLFLTFTMLASCTYNTTIEVLALPDAATPDASADAVADAALDTRESSAIDTKEAGPADASAPPDVSAPPSNTSCPFYNGPMPCGDASAFQVRKNDASIWIGCSYSAPACPSGWQCSGVNNLQNVEHQVCP